MNRVIRKSAYGDYFAIDYIYNNKIIETPLYLKKNEERKIKMRWDYEVSTGSQSFPQNCMVDAFIRYNGNIVEVCYEPKEMLSGGDKYWFEPTDWELLNKSNIHYKL